MTVHEIMSLAKYTDTLAKYPRVAIQALAPWDASCQAFAPLYERESENEHINGKVHCATFDVDAVQDLAQELGVRVMPTFYFFKDGEKTAEFSGANPKALNPALQNLADA